MTPSLLELKVTPSFCFAFKIPDDVTATINHLIDSLPDFDLDIYHIFCAILES